ncbi:MAG TPA: hypothetical protein VLV50_13000 [Stellaceae bacterium]|nr:hypothetical protein [Stellaceae bacterium]
MSATGIRLKPPWTLLSIAAALAVVLGFEWTGIAASPPTQRAVAPAAAPSVMAATQAFTPPPQQQYAEIAARPLFVPGRQPQDDKPIRQAPAPPPPALAVQGVVMSAGRHFAVIAHGSPLKYDSFGEGDTVDGWRIESIALDHLVLGAAGATVDVPVAKFDRQGTVRRRNPQ